MDAFIEGMKMFAPVLLSGMSGIGLLFSSFRSHIRETENGSENAENKESPADTADSLKKLHIFVGIVLTVAVIMALVSVWTKERSVTLFYLADRVPVYFHVDALGRLFITLTSVIWLAAGVYAFQYMKHEGEEKRFFGFFLLLYGVLLSLESAGNLITFYFFYELMTLSSMPLVMHNGSKESIMAGLKYLFYSLCGAYFALFGIYFLYQYLSLIHI